MLCPEATHVQVQALFTRALEREGLLDEILSRIDALAPGADPAELQPVLLSVSDNGAQMTSGSTREFMALHAIATHYGRPGTPHDQAHIESLFGHVKHDWPYLCALADPADLARELDAVRHQYNTVRLHAGVGYVTPDDEHEGRGPRIRRARRDGLVAPAPPGSPPAAPPTRTDDMTAPAARRRRPGSSATTLTRPSAQRGRAVQGGPTGPSAASRQAAPLTARPALTPSHRRYYIHNHPDRP